MNFEILYRPAHSLARVQLNAGETLVAEAGAMIGMDPQIQIETTTRGGMMSGFKRMLGGESFFINRFTAQQTSGEVLVAPPICGDMALLEVGPSRWFVQSTSFVASAETVKIETGIGGFKTFFGGEGIFVLKANGVGPLLIGAFGALEKIEINGSYVIDTGHLVAWEDSPSLRYNVTKSGSGWISSFLSGEGLVCEFNGQGTVWMQTRNPKEYGKSIGQLLPPKKR